MKVWPTIERIISETGAAALVTLAEAHGSSPREAGARMVVRPDGGFYGTIGGGTLEWIALAEAQAAIAAGGGTPTHRLDKALGPDLGQCCGGRVIVTIERFDMADANWIAPLAATERAGSLVTIATAKATRSPRRIASPDEIAPGEPAYVRRPDGRVIERFDQGMTPLYLFGAGHVGRALILTLAQLPFSITWTDPRPDAFPQHVPSNVTCVADSEPTRILRHAPDGAFVAVMTHSHALDLDLVAAALKAGRFPYVGLIGSATKRARFIGSLAKIGITRGAIDRLVCPIGLTQIRDKAPAAIAASITAQLLIMRDSQAQSAPTDETAPSTAAYGSSSA